MYFCLARFKSYLVILQKLQSNTMRKCLLQHLRRTLNAKKTGSIKMDLNTMKPCYKFLFWLLLRKIMTQSWKKFLDFITMKEAMILMRTYWKHSYKSFLKTFLLKNSCLLLILKITSEMEPKNFFAVPEWNRLWLIRNDFMTG